MSTSSKLNSNPREEDLKFNEYMQKAQEHFNGTKYADVLNSNPYINYQSGLLDWIGNGFGFATNEDKMRMAAQEYVAQLYQVEREEAFNSPAEQAQRMRQAGQNPDLLGTSGVSGATEFDQAMTTPQLQGPGEVVGSILPVFDMALGVFGKIQGLKAAVLANDESEFSLLGGMEGISKDIAADLYKNGARDVIIENGLLSYDNGNDEVNLIKLPKMNRRNENRFKSYFSRYFSSPRSRSDYYGSAAESAGNRREFAEKTFGPDSAREDEPAEVLRDVLVPILEQEFKKKSYDTASGANRAVSEFDRSLGEMQGNNQELGRSNVDAAVAQNELSEQTAGSQKALASTYSRIVKSLAKKAESGNDFAAAMLLVMSALSNMSVNASQSQGPKGLSKSFGIGF